MAHTLSTVRDQVENHLLDATNLIWSTTVLDEAIRAALVELSRVYGSAQTLNGLDTAAATTFADQDVYTLIRGAVAYALTFRVVGRYEEATPEPKLAPSFAILAQDTMSEFRTQLTFTDLRLKQHSTNTPQGLWEWEEDGGF